MTPAPVDVSVLTTGHDVADARLHREVHALLGAGLSVEVHGLGHAEDGPAGAAVTTASARGRLSRVRRAAALPRRARGRVLVTLDPEIAVTSVALRGRRRVVVDVHEDYSRLLSDRTWARGPRRLAAAAVVRAFLAAAGRADLTVVADDHVPPHRARSRLVVRNVPVAALLAGPVEPDPTPRAVYVGDIRRSRGLRTMLAAVESTPDWTLDVVGPVAPEEAGWLDEWRRRSPAAGRVRFHGRRPPRESWEIARGAWAGLCLLDRTPAFEAALPSKVYEYLASGLPVLTSDLPRVARLVTESGAGAVARDEHEASATLATWSREPARLHAHREAARAWAGSSLGASRDYHEFAHAVLALLTEDP